MDTPAFRPATRWASVAPLVALCLVLGLAISAAAPPRIGTPAANPSPPASGWLITGSRSILLGPGAPGALDGVAVFASSMVRAANGSYLLYYTGYDGYQDHLMEAWSADGVTWSRLGEAVSLNSGNAAPFVMLVGNAYHMWFESIIWGSGPLGYLDQIYHTTSADGLVWTTPALALGIGNFGDWDGGAVIDPTVVRDASGAYRMYYTMAATNRSSAIGLATSPDLVNWTKWSGNPVLLPGEAGTWDDGGVGAPSVVTGSSWTVFFHGGHSFANQIGVATSVDGYAWSKDPQPFLTNETGSAWDSMGVMNPSWFGGASVPELVFDGYTGPYQDKIGVIPIEYVATGGSGATSWTVSGNGFQDGGMDRLNLADNGSLALGPFPPPSNRQVVLDVGPPGSADSVFARSPFVLKDTDGSYKMWYYGYDGSRNRMMYATSPDGVHWTKHGVVIDVLTPPYYFDSVGGQSVLKTGSTYQMWFSAGYWTGGVFGYWAQIYHANSSDGVNWNITGVALAPNQAWDPGMVNAPRVVQDAQGVFWLFYFGWDGTTNRIGVATSMNGTAFVPYVNNPIVGLGAPGTWDSGIVQDTSVVLNGSAWTMWYDGWYAGEIQIGLARSADGLNWTKDAANPAFRPESSPAWDDAGVGWPDFFVEAAGPRLYFAGSDGTYSRIGMTTFAPPSPVTYSGSYRSAVFDSGMNGTWWRSLNWTGAAPADTSLSIEVRTGNTSIPDASWSDWTNLTPAGDLEPPGTIGLDLSRTRFFQFGVDMSSVGGTSVPWALSVTVAYGLNEAPAAAPGAPSTGAWTNNLRPVLRWNATDPEGDPIVASVVEIALTSGFAPIVQASGVLPAGTSSWQVASNLSDGHWYWRVRAEDPYGLWSVSASSSMKIERTPPFLVVTNPFPGVRWGRPSLDVVWTAQDSGSGVCAVEVQVDHGTPLVVPPENSSAHLTGLADGDHTITVTAFDRAGNSQSVSISVTIDANLLSPTGPYGPWPLVALVGGTVAVAAVTVFLILRWQRKPKAPTP